MSGREGEGVGERERERERDLLLAADSYTAIEARSSLLIVKATHLPSPQGS